jgi:hypothetical protein
MSVRAASVSGLFVSTFALVVCAPPPVTEPAPAAAVVSPSVDAAPPGVEPEPPPKRPPPPVAIVNQCHDVAALAYGEPPNMHPASIARFDGDGGEGTALRERDGTLAVTLVDDKGNPLAVVHVSRHMKRVEIGRSCRTLHAH